MPRECLFLRGAWSQAFILGCLLRALVVSMLTLPLIVVILAKDQEALINLPNKWLLLIVSSKCQMIRIWRVCVDKAKLHHLKDNKVDEGRDWILWDQAKDLEKRPTDHLSVLFKGVDSTGDGMKISSAYQRYLPTFHLPALSSLGLNCYFLCSFSYRSTGSWIDPYFSLPTRLWDLKVGDSCILFLCCKSPMVS